MEEEGESIEKELGGEAYYISGGRMKVNGKGWDPRGYLREGDLTFCFLTLHSFTSPFHTNQEKPYRFYLPCTQDQ